ncbi:MAG TPA: bifunctional oligoribonuclease/PAP phosphatase NrnA, partial [Candidatus Omnitrophota bacterium]|nr:bifunctional oligoribonuclease/PAP phosphatase NrnA [Candidatus Omnitrophota bacterium]
MDKVHGRKRTHATVEEVCSVIKRHRNFLLSAHVRPEGDSVGSMLAILSLLTKLGKRAWIVSEDAFPSRLDVMPRKAWMTLRQFRALPRKPKFDACIFVDCPRLDRIGEVRKLVAPGMTLINIDHHVTNGRFGDFNLVNDRAASCGEIVYDLFKKCGIPITQKEALPLYVSLTTDTGSFRFSNTSAKTHRVVADLIETGIDLETINDEVYARFSLERTRLLSDLLRDIKIGLNGKVVWAVIRREMFRKRKASFEDAEGFIDSLRFIRGVRIAFLAIEAERNEWQVSFRAKGPYDVSRIA